MNRTPASTTRRNAESPSTRNEGRPAVRFAVVGLGSFAQAAVLPAFSHTRRHATLAALVSGDAEKRRALSQRYRVGATGSYEEFESLLDSAAVDAVYIALPNSFHREYAARTRKPVPATPDAATHGS